MLVWSKTPVVRVKTLANHVGPVTLQAPQTTGIQAFKFVDSVSIDLACALVPGREAYKTSLTPNLHMLFPQILDVLPTECTYQL